MPDLWHDLRNLNNVRVLFYPMFPDFRNENFPDLDCPSGKRNMLMKQAVRKVTYTMLEHTCKTDWPLGVSPCFESDSSSDGQEFSLLCNSNVQRRVKKTPSFRFPVRSILI